MPDDRAGSKDDHPPVLLYGDDYEFACIGHPADQFAVYRSKHTDVSKAYIVARLRDIADRIEDADGGDRR